MSQFKVVAAVCMPGFKMRALARRKLGMREGVQCCMMTLSGARQNGTCSRKIRQIS